MVIEGRFGPAAGPALDRLIANAPIAIVPVDRDQAQRARDGFRRFGRGRHPAALNFGDCFAYALAASAKMPLLFKGDEFARTDIPAVDLTPYRPVRP